MLLSVSLAMMLATSPSADPVGAGRKASKVQPSMEQKLTLGDFQSEIKKQCATQEAAFRAAIVADDKANKMSDKDAQTDADEQVAEYIDKITAEYEDYNKPG